MKKKGKLSDIRRGDLVKIKSNLTDEDMERIQVFAKNISKQEEMYAYAERFLDKLIEEGEKCLVWKCGQTKKGTDYAVLLSKCDEENHVIHVPIQARFLLVSYRKPSHPLTNIFQEKK